MIRGMQLKDLERIVNADVRNNASPEEAAWLREPSILPLWQRQLRKTLTSLRLQEGERRGRLNHMKPASHLGEQAGPEYVQAKKDYERWHSTVLRMERAVMERIEESDELMIIHGVDVPRQAAMTLLLKVLSILDEGRPEHAKACIELALERWTSMTAS